VRRRALLAALLLAAPFSPGCGKKDPAEALAAAAREAGTANGLCPVQESLVVPGVRTVEYQGKKVGFCCAPCPAKFEKDPEKYMAKVRADPARFGWTP
jgi:hypothetical protein